jgi:type IV pilus assembly protein PilA
MRVGLSPQLTANWHAGCSYDLYGGTNPFLDGNPGRPQPTLHSAGTRSIERFTFQRIDTKMSKLTRKSNKGFTLIELMIVVAIIGILAAIAIPNFLRFQLKSKSSEGKVNIAAIRTAEESYNAEFGVYVQANQSPLVAAIGSQKAIFADTGAVGANFNQLGWAPEGNVFFSYGVAWGLGVPSAYTISATANIDADATNQAWGYVKPVTATLVGIVGLDGTCVATGVGTATPPVELNTVGPCANGHGQSIF